MEATEEIGFSLPGECGQGKETSGFAGISGYAQSSCASIKVV
jgi:CO dehydrogenase/acetyl-CoA synthase beta subunit